MAAQIFRQCFCQLSGVYQHYSTLYFCFCIQNCLLHLKLLSYNRHASCVTKFLLEIVTGLYTVVGCMFNGGPHPCMPCVWCFFGPGLRCAPFSTSHPNPCVTCDGERSPIHCSTVKAERPRGHLSPGNWWWRPCRLSMGWPWRNPCGHYHLHHCLARHLEL